MDPESKSEFTTLPFELVEKIAWNLPLSSLKDFRLANNRCAAAGHKSLLSLVPSVINSSTFMLPGRYIDRELHKLLDLTSLPQIAKVITSLTVGRGAENLDHLPSIRLPILTHFRLRQLEIDDAEAITAFLSNHSATLQSIDLNKLNLIIPLASAPDASNSTLPTAWQSIFLTIRSLPHIWELAISDLGYYSPDGNITYRIWIDPEHMRKSGASESDEGEGEVFIEARTAQAKEKAAVEKALDAVLSSTGKKVLKFRVGG